MALLSRASLRLPCSSEFAPSQRNHELRGPALPASWLTSSPCQSSGLDQRDSANALWDQQQRRSELLASVLELRRRSAAAKARLSSLQNQATGCQAGLSDGQARHAAQVLTAVDRQAAVRSDLEKLKADAAPDERKWNLLSKGVAAKELECQRQQQRIGELAAAWQLKEAEAEAKTKLCKILAEAEQTMAEKLNAFAAMAADAVPAFRTLHNCYLNLKGNIRVFCRLRPARPEEVGAKFELDDHSITFHSVVQKNVTGLVDQSSSWDFSFDQVFAPESSQEQVFEEIVPLVQSALDGYKVAIFAYGQTGGGKTYTMDGPQGPQEENTRGEHAGIIPRTVDLIFQELEELIAKGWHFDLAATLLEVYNEAVYDLLSVKGSSAGSLSERRAPEAATGTDPRHSADMFTSQTVKSAAAVHLLLRRAARERRTASTLCNDRSSRSHAIFQLSLRGRRAESEEVSGLLSLVDLAGSERVEKSGASGERLKEAQYINRSLSALGDVVEALAKKGQKADPRHHVPYRNSRLTMLLKESLGGDSKALMFVNISPCQHHLAETLSSLRFASKVHACNVGVAKRTCETKVKRPKASLDLSDWHVSPEHIEDP